MGENLLTTEIYTNTPGRTHTQILARYDTDPGKHESSTDSHLRGKQKPFKTSSVTASYNNDWRITPSLQKNSSKMRIGKDLWCHIFTQHWPSNKVTKFFQSVQNCTIMIKMHASVYEVKIMRKPIGGYHYKANLVQIHLYDYVNLLTSGSRDFLICSRALTISLTSWDWEWQNRPRQKRKDGRLG